jgi:hypothetical protein
VTVGIGVLCEHGSCAVLASDTRVTYGRTKVNPHDFAGKQFDFPPFNFAGAMAGSPSSTHAVFSEIAGRLTRLLQMWLADKPSLPDSLIHFEHIRNIVEASRKRELRRLQSCAMESDLGVSINDWIAGKLPTGQAFNELALREGLRVLRRVKDEMPQKAAILMVGFIRENPIFCRGLGAAPIEEAASPHIHVIGGQGAVDALQVLIDRKQNVEMGIARTLTHLYEALKAARRDKGVGEASAYVVMRPWTVGRPHGMLRIKPDHPQLKQWAKDYASKDTDWLDTPTANDLINRALFPNPARRGSWIGPREVMEEL